MPVKKYSDGSCLFQYPDYVALNCFICMSVQFCRWLLIGVDVCFYADKFNSYHQVIVTAETNKTEISRRFYINVTDENDNTPKFSACPDVSVSQSLLLHHYPKITPIEYLLVILVTLQLYRVSQRIWLTFQVLHIISIQYSICMCINDLNGKFKFNNICYDFPGHKWPAPVYSKI